MPVSNNDLSFGSFLSLCACNNVSLNFIACDGIQGSSRYENQRPVIPCAGGYIYRDDE